MRKFKVLKWNNLFGLPIKYPLLQTRHHKNTSERGLFLIFKPSDYQSSDPEERSKMAFRDAQNHVNFYKDLVKKELLPPGTKVKAKRMRHTDSYHLEIVMPHVPLSYTQQWRDIRESYDYRKGDEKVLEYNISDLAREIRKVARNHGYDYEHHTLTTNGYSREESGEFSTDLNDKVNYRFNKKGKPYYIDTEILVTKLPFPNRKDSSVEKVSARNKREAKKEEGLEGKVYLIVAAFSILGSMMFFSLTGNVIGNTEKFSQNILSTIFLVLGLVGAFILSKYIIINK